MIKSQLIHFIVKRPDISDKETGDQWLVGFSL